MSAITITNPGVSLATSGASASAALPVVSGSVPSYCRFSTTAACHIRVGVSGVVAATTDTLLHPAESIILRTGSLTHVAAIQSSAAGALQVSPVDCA
jgi:hypothetical protein